MAQSPELSKKEKERVEELAKQSVIENSQKVLNAVQKINRMNSNEYKNQSSIINIIFIALEPYQKLQQLKKVYTKMQVQFKVLILIIIIIIIKLQLKMNIKIDLLNQHYHQEH